MKKFIGFLRKECYHILRDRRTLLILFGLPVVQLVLFGFAIRNELHNIDIAIIDHSGDVMTLKISERLTASGYFRIVGQLSHEAEIEPVFRSGRARMVVVFGPRFADRLVRDGQAAVHIITDASDPNMAQLAQGYATAIITGMDPQHRIEASGVRMLFNPEQKSAYLFVPGLMAFILMLVSALMTSITIVREKEQGTMEVLLASPLEPYQIILGKVIPYLFLAMINVGTVLIIARLVFHVPFHGSYLLFFALSLLFTIAALALGVLISTASTTQQTATLAAMAGLMLPTILLSGFIFPIENMPVLLQWISHIVPAKWYLIIIKGIMLKGAGLAHLWLETMVLGGMTIVLLALSLKTFRIRLE